MIAVNFKNEKAISNCQLCFILYFSGEGHHCSVVWNTRSKIVPPFLFIQLRIGFELRINSELNRIPDVRIKSNPKIPKVSHPQHFTTLYKLLPWAFWTEVVSFCSACSGESTCVGDGIPSSYSFRVMAYFALALNSFSKSLTSGTHSVA